MEINKSFEMLPEIVPSDCMCIPWGVFMFEIVKNANYHSLPRTSCRVTVARPSVLWLSCRPSTDGKFCGLRCSKAQTADRMLTQNLVLFFFHRLKMTEILLKGTLTHQSIHLKINLKLKKKAQVDQTSLKLEMDSSNI